MGLRSAGFFHVNPLASCCFTARLSLIEVASSIVTRPCRYHCKKPVSAVPRQCLLTAAAAAGKLRSSLVSLSAVDSAASVVTTLVLQYYSAILEQPVKHNVHCPLWQLL
jgi:hypothetical protein